jgi:hypothetical protein
MGNTQAHVKHALRAVHSADCARDFASGHEHGFAFARDLLHHHAAVACHSLH